MSIKILFKFYNTNIPLNDLIFRVFFLWKVFSLLFLNSNQNLVHCFDSFSEGNLIVGYFYLIYFFVKIFLTMMIDFGLLQHASEDNFFRNIFWFIFLIKKIDITTAWYLIVRKLGLKLRYPENNFSNYLSQQIYAFEKICFQIFLQFF